MRTPARIKTWLSVEDMFEWVQKAPDEPAHKRRMAIWLTYTGQLHAAKVAQTLGVSVQAIWLWVRQYNSKGPEGLDRKGRGGRRWAFLSPEREAELLQPFIQQVRSGKVPKASEIRGVVQEELNRSVSMPYIYRLLYRHGWPGIIAQSQRVRGSGGGDDFEKLTRPWLRDY